VASLSPISPDDVADEMDDPYATNSSNVQVYPGVVSVLPGEPIPLKVSTPATRYEVSVSLFTASGLRLVYHRDGLAGHDERWRVTIEAATHVVRANWPTALEVPTTGFRPGIYIVIATDDLGTRGYAILVVRTPIIDRAAPAFVYDALTQAAYNRWGGWSFYPPDIATEVSFDRPLWRGGLGSWPRYDRRLVLWLLGRYPNLQFTTDYDLAIAPPLVSPRTLILGFHTEYAPATLRDWVREHVDVIGDMNLAIFGANTFYWRVRLEPSATTGAPEEMVCYKLDRAADPGAGTDPTGRYRDLGQPEGLVLGSQYQGMVESGTEGVPTRVSETVTAAMPRALLAGTGWRPGTVLNGILEGEADAPYPGTGAIAITTAQVGSVGALPITAGMTIWMPPSGARVFDAGTFATGDGLAPPRAHRHVAPYGFDAFVRNLLGWLGAEARNHRNVASDHVHGASRAGGETAHQR
jgi:hypothetical protein